METEAYRVSWNGWIDADCGRALQRKPDVRRWSPTSKWASAAEAARAALRDAGTGGLVVAYLAEAGCEWLPSEDDREGGDHEHP